MNLARLIDHTLLKPEATEADIRRLVGEALEYGFATVCVNGRWVRLAAELIRAAGGIDMDFAVKICCVVGFPLGAVKPAIKAAETVAAIEDGAGEIDMVAPLNLLLEGQGIQLRDEIFQVVKAAHRSLSDVVVKVILETAALTEPQTALGCGAARAAGADFVKTSTGFHPRGGATVETVRWLARYADGMGVKASGGIKDHSTALAMISAGATRLGTSSGVAIMRGESSAAAY
jgi:deoxyribose-phosphate aldolase